MDDIDFIREIIARHRYRQSLLDPYLDEFGGSIQSIMIRGPSGCEVILDLEMLSSIRDLASLLGKDDRFISNNEWVDFITKNIAYALDGSNSSADLDIAASDVLDSVKLSIDLNRTEEHRFEFTFGCTLFEGVTPPPHWIGPVCFETRQDWLERKFTEGAISDVTRRRVLRAWEGKTLRKRRESDDSQQEKTILGLSNDVSFICSVATNGMAYEFGRQRARTAARLALAAVALLWQKTSRVLGKMNLAEDRAYRTLHELTFRDGQPYAWGLRDSHMPSGQRLSMEEWDKLKRDFADHFIVIGDLLNSIVDTTTQPKCPKTTHALTHALLWFHQGCREDEDVIAVINFAVALDCLALGETKQGITRLIKVQLGVDADKTLSSRDSQNVAEVVEEIYDHARNATLHGRMSHKIGKPESKPFHDWSLGRGRAEELARECLLACIDWTAQHPDSDDPEFWQYCK